METKKFKIKGAEKSKGGKILNQGFVAAAGTAVIGGFSAGAGYAVVNGTGKDSEAPQQSGSKEEVTHQPTGTTDAGQSVAQQPAQSAAQPQPAADEYQPTDGGLTPGQPQPEPAQNQAQAGEQAVAAEEEVDPNLVAEALVQEIDPNDIDAENVLTIEQIGTVNAPDGTEIMAAIGHLPDGTQLLLTDIDGDGIFSDVFDMDGNYAGQMEGYLTAGDLIEMYDNTGGYLAMTETPVGDDPVNGITNTEPVHETNQMAQQDSATDYQPSDEELLAMLTDEIDTEEEPTDRLIDETTSEDEESENEIPMETEGEIDYDE